MSAPANPDDEPTGWAVAIDGKISLRSASYRPEAAMINGLVLFAGIDAYRTGGATDDQIRKAWRLFVEAASAQKPSHKVEIVEVVAMLRQAADGPLPKGISPSAKGQDSPAVSVAQEDGVPDGHFELRSPEFSGVQVQVQHPTSSSMPPCDEPGVIGISNLQASDGRFRAVLAITHADGTSLAAIMGAEDYLAFGDVYTSAGTVLGRPHGEA